MIDENPNDRPTAESLLELDVFKEKHTVSLHAVVLYKFNLFCFMRGSCNPADRAAFCNRPSEG